MIPLVFLAVGAGTVLALGRGAGAGIGVIRFGRCILCSWNAWRRAWWRRRAWWQFSVMMGLPVLLKSSAWCGEPPRKKGCYEVEYEATRGTTQTSLLLTARAVLYGVGKRCHNSLAIFDWP